MTSVDILNRRFAERLGRPNGTDPRFKWAWTPDLPCYRQINGEIARTSWASRIGPCWVLCEWKMPTLTREQWAREFGASYPYPANGRYIPFPEVSLPRGMAPNDEQTEFYCRTLRTQLEMSWQEQLDRSEIEAQYYRKEADARFDECVADWEPLSWKLGEPHDFCDHDGPVAFQSGLGESPALRNKTLQGAL